jgi:predicted ester cyclase
MHPESEQNIVAVEPSGTLASEGDASITDEDHQELIQRTRALVEQFLVDGDTAAFGEEGTLSIPTTIEPLRGSEAIARWISSFRAGMPDLTFTLTQLLVEGGRAGAEFTFSGTNIGPYMGIEPSGHYVRLPLAGFFDVKGHTIGRGRLYYDQGELARQIVGA